jgi:hypothetical protein
MGINLEREEMALLEAFNNEKNCMLYRPSYNSYIQSTTATILLCQILYWAKKRDFQPFYKTNESWCHDLKISIQELRTAKNRLAHLGLIEIIVKGVPAKSFYKVCAQNVMKMLECIEEETSQDSLIYDDNQFVDSNKQECDIQQTKMLLATQQSVATNTTVCWKPPTTTETTHKIKQKTTTDTLSSVPSELPLVAHAPRVGLQEEISSKEKIQDPQTSLAKPKPLKKPKINLSHLETQFEEWYRIYPRRDARANALKAFLKALQKISFEKLIECTRAYAKLVESRERDKICMPASWLNGERWTDESLSSHVSNLQASKSPKVIHPEFDPLLKICNWIAPSYLGFSWLEREGDCLFVNSDLSFVSDQLKQFDDYFQKAYETTNVYFRHKPKGENVCNQN